MGVSYVINFDVTVSEVFMAHHLFELLIRQMCYLAILLGFLHLLLGVTLKILSYCLQHDDSILAFARVDVGYTITEPCVALEGDFLSLGSRDYPVTCGTVGNRVAILFELWNRQ